MAMGPNRPVAATSEARELEDLVREFERLLGRKMILEAVLAMGPRARPREILKGALSKAGARRRT